MAAEATSPKTTNTIPTSISKTTIDRKAEPVTTELAMLVVILVTFADGKIAARLANAPKTASMTTEKMPAMSSPSPVVMISLSPMYRRWTRRYRVLPRTAYPSIQKLVKR